jgi:hypothetical protein
MALVKHIEEQFAGLSPEIVHKITCENAASFYGLITNSQYERGRPTGDRRRRRCFRCYLQRKNSRPVPQSGVFRTSAAEYQRYICYFTPHNSRKINRSN